MSVVISAPVGEEEVVDDLCAIAVSHGAQPGHSGEREWADKLTERQFEVEVVEFGACLLAPQQRVEGLSVLVDESRTQRAG
jgi:hypothetical protein